MSIYVQELKSWSVITQSQTGGRPKIVELSWTILERQRLGPDFIRSICFSDESHIPSKQLSESSQQLRPLIQKSTIIC